MKKRFAIIKNDVVLNIIEAENHDGILLPEGAFLWDINKQDDVEVGSLFISGNFFRDGENLKQSPVSADSLNDRYIDPQLYSQMQAMNQANIPENTNALTEIENEEPTTLEEYRTYVYEQYNKDRDNFLKENPYTDKNGKKFYSDDESFDSLTRTLLCAHLLRERGTGPNLYYAAIGELNQFYSYLELTDLLFKINGYRQIAESRVNEHMEKVFKCETINEIKELGSPFEMIVSADTLFG